MPPVGCNLLPTIEPTREVLLGNATGSHTMQLRHAVVLFFLCLLLQSPGNLLLAADAVSLENSSMVLAFLV